jgi:putative NIF3 family GTP cyclohydrolase 1 type 2
MKASEIASVFETIAPIESGIADDRAALNLGFAFGDRDIEVAGVGVAWWLSQEVVEQAIAKGLNFLICHEPQLFRFWASPLHTNMRAETMPCNLRKMKLLLDHNMCVYTAHTNWDLQFEVGMGPTLARTLGFDKRLKWDGCVGIYEVNEMTFGKLVAHVKSRMGLSHVRIAGDDDMPVRKVALGFGAIGSETEAIVANGADAGIFGELREWAFLSARESGVGIIETTHLVSESIGFGPVVTEMSRLVPNVKFQFLEIPFPYRTV